MSLFWRLLTLLALAAIGALAWHLMSADPGYVLVRYGGRDISTTLVAALLLLCAALGLLGALLYLLWLPLRLWLGWRRRRMRRRLSEAQTALFLGQPQRALQLLAKVRGRSTEPVASLASADAERALGRTESARARLEQLDPKPHGAVRALALAEHAALLGDAATALALLDDPALRSPSLKSPPPRALWLRARLLAEAGQVDAALALLPALRKVNAAAPADVDAAETVWASRALTAAADVTTLARRWDALPATVQARAAVLLAWAARAEALRWPAGAAEPLAAALQTQRDPALLRALGRIGAADAAQRARQRAVIEQWLQRDPDDAAGLLALARITRAEGQPVAAEALLHRVLARADDAEAWELLGQWRAAAADDAAARRCFANALAAQRGASTEALPGRDLRQRIAAAAAVEERDELGMPRLPGGT